MKIALIRITSNKRKKRTEEQTEEDQKKREVHISLNASANEQRCDEQNPAVVEARVSARSLSISMCFYCVS